MSFKLIYNNDQKIIDEKFKKKTMRNFLAISLKGDYFEKV